MTLTDLFYYGSGASPDPLSFEVAPAVRGRVAYAPMVLDPEAAVAECVAVLVRSDSAGELQPVETLDEAWGHAWQAALHDPGDGSLTLDNIDPDLADIVDGDMIQMRLHGQAVFTWRVGDNEQATIADGEEHDQVTTLKGPGHISVLSTAEVFPSRGTGALPPEEDRTFNWSSVPFDDGTWGNASQVTLVDAAQAGDWAYQPFGEGFPALSGAYMIWAAGGTADDAPEGDCYFRKTFNMPLAGRMLFYVLVDNWGEVFFDGQRILSIEPTAGFTTVTTIGVDVSVGDHLIAVWGHNSDDDSNPGGNPGGVALAAYTAGPNNQPTAAIPLVATDGSWKIVAYPPYPPGMTPGEVIRVAVGEAQTRGGLEGVTLGFSDTTDSDGVAWPLTTDIATKVGNDVWTFLQEMAGTYVDLWMEPARLRLHAYVKGGLGADSGVDLHAATDPTDPTSGNLVNLAHRRVGQVPVNSLLVKWHGGWAEAADATSIAAHGRREGLLALGAAQTQAEALRVAVAQLDYYAHPREQVSADIEPGGRMAEMPWVAFRVGDTVAVPDRAGSPVVQRCVRLSAAMDENGQVTFAGDFGDELLSPAERWELALKKMSDGTLRGTSPVATPASGVKFDVGGAKPDCCPPVPPPGDG